MSARNPVLLVGTIAWSQWREQWRSRSFLVAIFFSGILIYASILLGTLAVDQELRALFDFGQSFIELLGLALVVYGAATGILREIETKTLYLILTRPVPRLSYLLGRYFGLLLTSLGAVVLMAVVHVCVLLSRGWKFDSVYLVGLYGIALKLSLASALATFLALFTTSVLSALTVTGIFWALGHFIPEITSLSKRSLSTYGAVPLTIASYLIPNLSLLNFRDRVGVPSAMLPSQPMAAAALYTALYSTACLILAYAIFRRKEF